MDRIRKKSFLWGAALLLYVLFIFSNSMKPAAQSSAESGFALRILQNMQAAAGLEWILVTEHILRKSAHFAEYTLLGILIWKSALAGGRPASEQIEKMTIGGFLVPFVDETIQLFTAGRSGQISDVWLDCSGVAFGALLCWLARGIAGRRRVAGDGD